MGNGLSATGGIGGLVSFNWGDCKQCFAPNQPAFWATAVFLSALGYLVFLHFKLIRIG